MLASSSSASLGVSLSKARQSFRPFSTATGVSSRSKGSQRLVTTAAAMTEQQALLHGDTFFLDNFAIRQWDDPNYSGTRISFDKATFVQRVHEMFKADGCKLVDGYASFCKHVFVPNFVGAKLGALEITAANKQHLRSAYTRRRPEELAVLTRWFSEAAAQPVPEAKYLDLILYSREQLIKEYQAMPSKTGGDVDPDKLLPNVPWGIISIKAQDEPFETPMQPITMMRNALGREEGGSGVPLNKEAYEASTAYWQTHAPIVAGEEPSGE